MATSAAAGSRGQARLTRRCRPGPGTRPVPARAVPSRAHALVTATPWARAATRGWPGPAPGRPVRCAGPACAATLSVVAALTGVLRHRSWAGSDRERDPGQLFGDCPQAALDGRVAGLPAGFGQFRVAPGPEQPARAVVLAAGHAGVGRGAQGGQRAHRRLLADQPGESGGGRGRV